MSHRARSVLFFGLAGLAALAGAMLAGRYREGAIRSYGELRPALVTTAPLAAGRPLTAGETRQTLEQRRVPESFLPADAIEQPEAVIGLSPNADLPPGTYLTQAMLAAPAPAARPRRQLAPGRIPVELQVSGAAAVTAAAGRPASGASHTGGRPRVDVAVTDEPAGAGTGRTRIAASDVPVIAMPGGGGNDAPGLSRVVLGLTRPEALRLIHAEAFARSLRLLPRPP